MATELRNDYGSQGVREPREISDLRRQREQNAENSVKSDTESKQNRDAT